MQRMPSNGQLGGMRDATGLNNYATRLHNYATWLHNYATIVGELGNYAAGVATPVE